MSPLQSRLARVALDWTTADLARAAKVGVNTVNRFERGRDVRLSSVEKMEQALKVAGIIFIFANGGGPGVRLRDPVG